MTTGWSNENKGRQIIVARIPTHKFENKSLDEKDEILLEMQTKLDNYGIGYIQMKLFKKTFWTPCLEQLLLWYICTNIVINQIETLANFLHVFLHIKD